MAGRRPVAVVEQFVPAEEFRRVLENTPAGLFTTASGAAGMSDSECLYRRCHGIAFLTAHLVRRQARFSADNHDVAQILAPQKRNRQP